MGGKQRVYKKRIASTETLAKVFRAMELIAASRIGPARKAAEEGGPFDRALTQAVAAVAMHSNMVHPLTTERTDTNRVAILAIASDRGMAGAYAATILRETDKLMDEIREQGKEPVLYICGRRAVSYYRFRKIPLAAQWTGESDSPSHEMADDVARTLLEAFLAEKDKGGVDELRIVFTRFKTMVKQVPEVRKMLPLTVIDDTEMSELDFEEIESRRSISDVMPLYEFEPSAEGVMDILLPMYVRSRIRNALLQAAASELASRQTAMHTANDNAHDLIENYTRLANSARQAEITQELTEIVSGADALASA
ncbi:MAG: F0F1 ATP synthase subunit gamma [Actinomycetaceae bacterium]|nr:F0F1 ATP synthase subunit gamma [Actinomycetaceae bacterium]